MFDTDSGFEFLFKHRPSVYEAGTVSFVGSTLPVLAVVLLVAAVSAWSYLRLFKRSQASTRDLVIMGALRALALGCATVSLLEPTLRILTVAPQQSFVGILLDDSASLTIADGDGGARRDTFIEQALLDREGSLRRALEAKFKLRFFSFSSHAERLQQPRLAFDGSRTDLAAALARAREELADVPLSGLVLVTDGADNVAGPLSETLLDLKTRQVPVFPIGLGREAFTRDVEITRVEAPTTVLQGSTVVASVTLKAKGAGRAPLKLSVEDSGRILSARDVDVSASESSTARIAIRADEPAPRLLQFKVAALEGEQVALNNEFAIALDVVGRREKILYLEGAARYEAKFLRRAVEQDQNLQVVTLERTSDDKFLRLDVDDGEELAAGFPKTREELFRYRGLVLGGVEASFFTVDQVRMLTDFVSQRGGGLLMLGSENTFGEGGYAGTAVAEALPVAFDTGTPPNASSDEGNADRFQWLKIAVTPLGASQPVTQLAATEAENEERFAKLPQLSSVNNVTRVKPGASTLLTSGAPGNAARVVLAFQRYGRGRAFAFPVQDSWRWQMHADLAADDLSHEVFWRQMLRQLVGGVSGPVALTVSSSLVAPGTSVTLVADVSDETFIRVNDASVNATIKAPSGEVRDVALRWTVEKDGEYVGELALSEPGVHQVRVEARRGDRTLGEETTHVRVLDQPLEFRGAEMKAETLRRIASETGGRFHTPATASRLPEDLSFSPRTASVMDEKELWDMPALFLGILMALCAEWSYRKLRGFA